MRMPQRGPSKAQSLMRPSIHQDAWAAQAVKGCGWGAAAGARCSAVPGIAGEPWRVSAMRRATVRTERAVGPRRLQIRKPPAAG